MQLAVHETAVLRWKIFLLSSLPSRYKKKKKSSLIKSSSCFWIFCLCHSSSLTNKWQLLKIWPLSVPSKIHRLLHLLTITHALSVGRILNFSPCLCYSLSYFPLLFNFLQFTVMHKGRGGVTFGIQSTAEHLLLYNLLLIPAVNNLEPVQ